MRTGRQCDWCKNDAVFSYMVPEPQGAVVPESYTQFDFCNDVACVHNAVNILANHLNSRPYPASISFSVVDV